MKITEVIENREILSVQATVDGKLRVLVTAHQRQWLVREMMAHGGRDTLRAAGMVERWSADGERLGWAVA